MKARKDDDARGTVIALLGAESTGKTTLAAALNAALRLDGHSSVTHVREYLREFCDAHARTPRRDEQRAIADEQSRRIEAAAAAHDIVIADTTSLMTAVYSDTVFGDAALYPAAEADHARCALTLLTALDLPWQPDGPQRDGPQMREPVDARVRAALDRAALPYAVICGRGETRLQAALASVRRVTDRRNHPNSSNGSNEAGEPDGRFPAVRRSMAAGGRVKVPGSVPAAEPALKSASAPTKTR